MSAFGVVSTADTAAAPAAPAPASIYAAAPRLAPLAPVTDEPGDPGASVTIDAVVPQVAEQAPKSQPHGAATPPDDSSPPVTETAGDEGQAAASVAAPDPTPLTLSSSPLATQLMAQSSGIEPREGASLAAAVLPPMPPDVAAQQAAFAAEQARVAELVEQHIAALKAEAEARAAEEARRAHAWVMPLATYRLSARFGQAGSLWSSGRHTGIDLSAATGTPLVAMQDAVVVSAGYAGAYGNRTVLRLADGTELWYAHQSRIEVEAGQVVRKGDQIGLVGSTGNVTGPHLHLEVRPKGGDPVDPLPVMAEHGLEP